jgi:uncharacterized Zn finger protein (UPF0148 family)
MSAHCPNCGQPTSSDSIFCPYSGMKLEKESEHVTSPSSGYCPECGAAIQEDTVYCPNCGAKIPLSFEYESMEPVMEGRHLQECPNEWEERRPSNAARRLCINSTMSMPNSIHCSIKISLDMADYSSC